MRFRRGIGTAIVVMALGTGGFLMMGSESKAGPEEGKGMGARIFEMRTYIAHPGKLEALNARFRNHTNYLFVKHGITLVGYWTPAEGKEAENTLIYILGFPSREAREKSWKAFLDDPAWKKAKSESEADGPLVSRIESKFLLPTDYSPIR